MAKVYAEFGIEIFDRTLLEQCYNSMKPLGEVEIKETTTDKVIVDEKRKRVSKVLFFFL